jgi:hypothetical protein
VNAAVYHGVIHLLERRDVVHYPYRPAVRAQDEVIFTGVDQNVVNRNGRKISLDLRPITAAIRRGKKAEFRPDE